MCANSKVLHSQRTTQLYLVASSKDSQQRVEEGYGICQQSTPLLLVHHVFTLEEHREQVFREVNLPHR